MAFPDKILCPCGSGKELERCCSADGDTSLEQGAFESWIAKFRVLDLDALERTLASGAPDFEPSGTGQWTWLRPEGGARQERALLFVADGLLVAATPTEDLAGELRALLEERIDGAIAHVGTARRSVDEHLVPSVTRYPHLVADLRDYLDGDDLSIRVPREERTIGLYLGRITAAVSAARSGVMVDTRVPCRRRPGNRPCKSDVTARLDDGDLVQWNCPRCGDSGTISGWLGTPFDSVARSTVVSIEDLTPTTYMLRLRNKEHLRLLRLPHLTAPALRLLANAMPLPAGFVRISGSRSEFVAASRCIVFQFARGRYLTKGDADTLSTLHSTFALHGGGRPDLSMAAQCAEVLLFERSRRLALLPDPGRSGGTHRLRIALQDVQPPIWRHLELPSRFTLEDLHEALILAFGWSDTHLHAFVPEGKREVEKESERRTLLSDVLPRVGDRLVWEYDFGDSWRHDVVVEAILPDPPQRPRLIGGARAAPPEDCGGPPGLENLLAILADPLHEEHETMRDWAGQNYDPDAFGRAVFDERVGRMEAARAEAPSRRGAPAWRPGER